MSASASESPTCDPSALGKEFPKDQIDMVIYHHPCNDGFGSAYVVWRYYKETSNDRDIEYVGVSHSGKFPDVSGKNVLICDYSYPLNVMEKIQRIAKSVLVIDHHATARKN